MGYKRQSPQPLIEGGTGVSTMTTAYAPVCAGITATGALQVASTGLSTSGFILTSTGSSSLPSFQAPASSSISITGDSGGALSGASFTFTGGTTGLTFGGSGSTETLSGTLAVKNGGTGNTTFTAYSLVAAGTTATGAFQNVSGVGTSGQLLTSNGASALPTWQTAGSASISITGNTGGALTGSSFTFSGGTTGLSFGGSGTTETLTFAGITANGGTVSLATDATTSAINIGTGTGNKSTTIGSSNTNSTTTINAGNGGVNVNGGSGGTTIANTNSNFVVTTGTGLIQIGSDSSTSLIHIGDAPGVGAKTILIGNGTGASSVYVSSGTGGITIDSSAGNGVMDIVSGTGSLSISDDANATSVNLGTGTAVKTIIIGSTTSTSSTKLQSGSGGIILGSSVAGSVVTNSSSVLSTVNGTSGTILTSNGAGNAPSFQTPASSSITLTGDSGGGLTGSSFTITGGTSGAVFAGSGTTLTESFNFLALPSTTSTNGQIKINGTPVFHSGHIADVTIGSAGFAAGNFTTTGSGNVCVGGNALNGITSGIAHVAIGYQAMQSGVVTGATGNVAIGRQCLQTVSSGIASVAIGSINLSSLTTGSYNISLGNSGGSNYTSSESSNILLNSNGVAAESNVLRIGKATGTSSQNLNSAYICGINGITVTGTAVLVSSGDQLGIAVSSARYKENIEDMSSYSSSILQLKPKTFNYTVGEDHSLQGGLIAEEVAEVMPSLVVYDKEGLPQTVKYHDLPALLLNELQKALKRIELLEAKLGA